MAAYELRAGDVKNKKQSVADLKYRRLQELNSRLKEDLDRPRVRISEAAISLVLPAIVPPQRRPSGIDGIGAVTSLIRRPAAHRWLFRIGGQRKRRARNAHGNEPAHRQFRRCIGRPIWP